MRRPQPLHARRPDRRLQSLRDVRFRNARIIEQADRGNGVAGIVDLVAALQLRQGQIEQAALILKDKPAMLLKGLPVLIGDGERRAGPFGDAFDLGPRLVGLRRR